MKGCDDAARAIQSAIGGEIKHITGPGRYLGPVADIGETTFKNPAGKAASGWSDHFAIEAYKARWLYADVIMFGF